MAQKNPVFPLILLGTVALILGTTMALAEPSAKSSQGGDGHRHRGGLFARLDKNADGKIERNEARTAAGDHFAKIDQNGDGKLTRAELGATRKARSELRRTAHFAEFDTNADGKIDRAEALAHADRRFASLDGNKDGQVTREEAHAALSAKHHGKGGRECQQPTHEDEKAAGQGATKARAS